MSTTTGLRHALIALAAALCLTPLLTLDVATDVLAHAIIIEKTIPETLPPDRPTKGRLRFNSSIEVSLTEVLLMDGTKTTHKLKVSASGKPGELEVEVPGLQPGSYALLVKAFSTDGHMTRELVRFRVQPAH